jgi:hypothetical protein
MRDSTMRRHLLAVFLLLTASVASAADAKLSGMVTVKGKPLAVGKVTFHLDNGQFVGSKVKDGKYEIDRVPTGTRKVTVEGEGVPAAYAREEATPLTVEVKEGKGAYDIIIR